MNTFFKLTFVLILGFSTCTIHAQIGNETGKYDKLIAESYKVLNEMCNGNKKAIKKRFVDTGFQEEKDFSNNITGKNLKWAKSVIIKFGFPDKKDISISEWKVATRNKEATSTSVNLTFYFSEKNAAFDPTFDHISLNFKSVGDEFTLDGVMFFKREEFLLVKEIIDNMP